MNIAKLDPFRALLDFPRSGFPLAAAEAEADPATRPWAPVVDIFEKGDDVVIRAEIPGVAKEDVSVAVEDGVLTLSGERKTDEEYEDANAYRRERFFGRFSRSFTMPETVDIERIEARFKDGVLEVRVPKVERVKPRKIEIEAA